ncbi:Protein NLRC3 [Pelomyxa schiedti]|nr:Protein NLRC3 [Pelomyxa schiedti]
MSADVWEQLYATECIDEGYRAPLDAMRRALEHPKCACKLLDINGRRIGDEGAAIIAQALSSNKSLVSLNMAGNDIGDEGAAIISRALSSNKSLVSLNLYGNNVGDEGATSIAQALSSNKSLVSLNMAGNNIGDEGAASIAQALSSNKSLVSLNLYSNNIGDEGAASIAQALSSNESLVSLNLYSNNIGAEGAASIAQALSSNKSLMSMDISGNNIGAEGAASISRALSSNKSLVSLNLYSNKIGDEGAAIIAQALSSNESLVSLHLYNNNIGDEGAASIAQALSSNKSLVSLNLFCNNIGDEGAASIAQALSSNKSLVSLNLYSNNIGAEGAAIISRALSSNKSLVNQSRNQRGAKGGVCTDTFLLWFSWLACATSPLASLLVLLEGAGADTYVFVGDTRRQTIDLGLGMYLVQLDNPMRDDPLVDLFSIPIEILNSHDQYPCSYPSPMSIAIGNKYFELNMGANLWTHPNPIFMAVASAVMLTSTFLFSKYTLKEPYNRNSLGLGIFVTIIGLVIWYDRFVMVLRVGSTAQQILRRNYPTYDLTWGRHKMAMAAFVFLLVAYLVLLR